MKIVLSRKGFDSSSGGIPSPILPFGQLCYLPIPSRKKRIPYANIRCPQYDLSKLLSDLTKGNFDGNEMAHLDPDLNPNHLSRLRGWRPIFGQAGAAQGHLHNQRVTSGDLFLFFGWFRDIEKHKSCFRFKKGAPDRHVLFGWLQVDQRLYINSKCHIPTWAKYHPHLQDHSPYGNDSLYIARLHLNLPGLKTTLPGGGTFKNYHPDICLSAPGSTRSIWKLPSWFHPRGRASTLTYHGNPNRWTIRDGEVLLNSVNRGQEFVLDTQHYPEAIEWIANLLNNHA
jgi:hypothetical protein